MTSQSLKNPSPLAGEGRFAQENEGKKAELGASSSPPHLTPRMCSASPSPARGEGTRRRRSPIIATKSGARRLRRAMTDAERKLWQALRAQQFDGLKFRRQVPVGPYVADILCYRARLVIELDGGQHVGSARDEVRDRWFVRNGFRVLRSWNNDVLRNLDGVSAAMFSAIAERQNKPYRLAGLRNEATP